MVLGMMAALAVQTVPVKQDVPRVTPLNVQEWITDDDYPVSARRNDAHGQVSFDLTIAGNGSVEHCEIAKSSGFDDLDAATCTLLAERARFSTPGAGLHYRSRVVWQLPQRMPQPIAWWHSAGLLHLSADNQILSCEEKHEGAQALPPTNSCQFLGAGHGPELAQIIGNGGKARTVVIEETSYFGSDRQPDRYYAKPGQVPIARRQVRFDITENGEVANCRDDAPGAEGLLSKLPSLCVAKIGPYVPLVDRAGKRHATNGVLELAISEAP